MNKKYALNKFSCHQVDSTRQAYNIKCRNLPKKTRKKDKEILRLIQMMKRGKI